MTVTLLGIVVAIGILALVWTARLSQRAAARYQSRRRETDDGGSSRHATHWTSTNDADGPQSPAAGAAVLGLFAGGESGGAGGGADYTPGDGGGDYSGGDGGSDGGGDGGGGGGD
jgi:hypothetical protein